MEEKVSAIQKITAETQKELTEVKLHIENVTDKNITLLAENYCNLVNKLDENNKVTDVQLAYQIKVNFLIDDMEKMKKEKRDCRAEKPHSIMIRYTKDNQKLNIRKLHREKTRICCEIQLIFFRCSFLRIKKEGQGFLPGI